MKGVFLRQHKDDSETLEIYTQLNHSIVIWGVVHVDILSTLKGDISLEDIENHEHELSIHFPGGRKPEIFPGTNNALDKLSIKGG